jgi:hypothetical protein
MTMEDLDRRVATLELLETHGAAELAHPGGTLLAHLIRTEALLQAWGAPPALRLAGLAHAVYGTDGFPEALVDHAERDRIVEVVGAEAEAIIHTYAGCDRGDLYPQLGVADPPLIRDRWSGSHSPLDGQPLRDFCELTFANELDLVADNPDIAAAYGPYLTGLFARCRPFVSEAAFAHFRHVLPV